MRALVLLAVPTLVALPLNAQLCEGAASFAPGRRFQALAAVSMNKEAVAYGAAFAAATRSGVLFAQAGAGKIHFSGLDESGHTVFGRAGLQAVIGAGRRVAMCSIVAIGRTSGPTNFDFFGERLDFTETDYSFGLALGAAVSSHDQMQLVPSGTVTYMKGTLTVDNRTTRTSSSETDSFFILGLAVGLVFNGRATLRPDIAFPINLEGGITTYGVSVGLNF